MTGTTLTGKQFFIGMAAIVATIGFSAKAETDILGKTPTHWYTYDGVKVSRGTYGLDYYNGSDAMAYSEVRSDIKGALPGIYWWGSNFYIGSGSFTFFASTTLGTTGNVALFSVGSSSSTSGNIALVRTSNPNTVVVVKWDTSTASKTTRIIGETVVQGGDIFVHTYAIAYDANTATLRLYVDGVLRGEGLYDGLGGASATSTKVWQMDGVSGGAPGGDITTFNAKNAKDYFLEDFRYYQEELTAAQVKTLSDTLPTPYLPYYRPPVLSTYPKWWYTFCGGTFVRHMGTLPTWNTAVGGYLNDPFGDGNVLGYRDIRPGQQSACAGMANWGSDFRTGGGSFTVFMSATSGNVWQGIIFALGSSSSNYNNLTLVSQGTGGVALQHWNGNTERETLLSSSLTTLTDQLHPYAIRFTAPTGSATQGRLALFIDGVKQGEVDFTPLNYPDAKIPWQFGSMSGGVASGYYSNTQYALEDIRLYQSALSDEDIVSLSTGAFSSGASPQYVGGVTGATPYYWYESTNCLNQGAVKRSVQLDCVSWECLGTVCGRKGVTMANSFRWPWGNGFECGTAASGFTFAISGRMQKKPSGVLFGMGARISTNNFAIATDGDNKVKVAQWKGDSTADTLTATLSVDLADYDRNLHTYVVTHDGTTLRFYIDGTLRGTSTDFSYPETGAWQIGGISGNSAVLNGDNFCVECLRLYKTVLTQAQIDELCAVTPAWPQAQQVWRGGDALLGSEEQWAVWDPSSWTDSLLACQNGSDALIDTDTTINLASPLTVGALRFDANITFNRSSEAFTCSSLTNSGTFAVGSVDALLKPGVKIANFTGAPVLDGFDLTTKDAFGNGYYTVTDATPTYLSFGKPLRGMIVIFH